MTHNGPAPLTKTENLDEPYVAAGDRAYVVGAQDGNFPDGGWHDPGEMHGVWAHPIKLLDGFWLQVDQSWLTSAQRFVIGTFWSRQEYDLSAGLRVTRTQFVPDREAAVVVRYRFESPRGRRIRCRLVARADLRLAWDPSSVPNGGGDTASYDAMLDAWCCCSVVHGGAVVIGTRGLGNSLPSGAGWEDPERRSGHGVSVALMHDTSLAAGQPAYLDLVVAGSASGLDSAAATFRRVCDTIPSLWDAKVARYARMLDRSAITVPDPVIERAWDWVKCDYDWLMRDVPGLGRALGAGMPEYPWWFGCDNEYALLGCLALGQHETVLTTLDFLRTISMAANGPGARVIHECTTGGTVTDAGRINETPQFVSMVWNAFLWTGDRDFLDRNYDFCKRGLLEWTLRDNVTGVGLSPSGPGMVEIAGLDGRCVDVAAYTVQALDALASMAEIAGDDETCRECLRMAAAAREQIEREFWLDDEGLYADVIATPRDMADTMARWLVDAQRVSANDALCRELQRLLWQAECDPDPDRDRSWLLKNWTVISPLETGIANRSRALIAFRRLEGPEFVGPWGMYLSALAAGDSMSVNSGALIMAELMYGRVDKAVELIRIVSETLTVGMPGAISEVLPDRGCFVQAWSGYAIAWPVVREIFGLHPDAVRQRLAVSPLFPSSWPRAEIREVRMGAARCDAVWDGENLRVHMSDPAWVVITSDTPLDLTRAWKLDRSDLSSDGGRDWVLRPDGLCRRKETSA
jgi:glycogen debranching enzyme